MQSAECGMQNGACGTRSAECGVRHGRGSCTFRSAACRSVGGGVMATPQGLEELQRRLLAAVTAPAAAKEGEIHNAILPSRQQSAAERLAVYQHAYVARLLDVLREQFPC